jgi:hypothetical protein
MERGGGWRVRSRTVCQYQVAKHEVKQSHVDFLCKPKQKTGQKPVRVVFDSVLLLTLQNSNILFTYHAASTIAQHFGTKQLFT